MVKEQAVLQKLNSHIIFSYIYQRTVVYFGWIIHLIMHNFYQAYHSKRIIFFCRQNLHGQVLIL